MVADNPQLYLRPAGVPIIVQSNGALDPRSGEVTIDMIIVNVIVQNALDLVSRGVPPDTALRATITEKANGYYNDARLPVLYLAPVGGE